MTQQQIEALSRQVQSLQDRILRQQWEAAGGDARAWPRVADDIRQRVQFSDDGEPLVTDASGAPTPASIGELIQELSTADPSFARQLAPTDTPMTVLPHDPGFDTLRPKEQLDIMRTRGMSSWDRLSQHRQGA